MNNIYTILEKAGFSPSEQKVYITGQNYPESASSQLVRYCKLPRPTVMAALQELRRTNLCQVEKRDGRSYNYTMQPISNLKAYLGKQARAIENLMEEIDIAVPEQPGLLDIATGSSADELQGFLELALRCKSRQWRIIAPRDNALRHLPAAYIRYFKRVRADRQISSQTLWEEAYKHQAVSLIDTLMRKPRYVPKEYAKNIPAVLLSFDNSILLVSGKQGPSSSLITSQDIAVSFNILFDLAWRSCRTDPIT